MHLKGKIQYLLKFSFPVILQKVINNLLEKSLKKRFHKNSLQEQRGQFSSKVLTGRTFQSISMEKLEKKNEIQEYLVEKYLQHRFDLLGSGWVKVGYDIEAPGLENFRYKKNLPIVKFDKKGGWLKEVVHPNHLQVSANYWQIITSENPDYQPIDWQKDFKSGHRWTATQWFKNQEGATGADIKNVLELARLQHLPLIAIAAISQLNQVKKLCYEFKHQLLDFFATNPPSMGVAYTYAMDVGIRAANILISYALLQTIESKSILDSDFEQILADNLYLHGLHILNDLEKREGISNNHYLANIVGLLFIANYLENTPEINQWLAFSMQELLYCMDYQFFEEGTNFEGSTCYHRLSTEMMLYAGALILGLSQEKKEALQNYSTKDWNYKIALKPKSKQGFKVNQGSILPEKFYKKLFLSTDFLERITKPNGEIPQFGDNDSGHFLKLFPIGDWLTTKTATDKYQSLQNYAKIYPEEKYFDENQLTTKATLAATLALFPNANSQDFTLLNTINFAVIKSLTRGNTFSFNSSSQAVEKKQLILLTLDKLISKYQLNYQNTTIIFSELHKSKTNLLENLEFIAYPTFQLWLFKSNRIYLAISGISAKQQHPSWGHIHNDKLSFELSIDGTDLIVDPGTYLYSPIPERRNEFRSAKAHNIAYIEGIEQNEPLAGKMGLFNLKRDTRIEVLEKSVHSITFLLTYRKVKQIRTFLFTKNKIILKDYSNFPFSVQLNRFDIYSNGYGKKLNG